MRWEIIVEIVEHLEALYNSHKEGCTGLEQR